MYEYLLMEGQCSGEDNAGRHTCCNYCIKNAEKMARWNTLCDANSCSLRMVNKENLAPVSLCIFLFSNYFTTRMHCFDSHNECIKQCFNYEFGKSETALAWASGQASWRRLYLEREPQDRKGIPRGGKSRSRSKWAGSSRKTWHSGLTGKLPTDSTQALLHPSIPSDLLSPRHSRLWLPGRLVGVYRSCDNYLPCFLQWDHFSSQCKFSPNQSEIRIRNSRNQPLQ